MASGSLRKSDHICECCGQSWGTLYQGNIYTKHHVTNVCPWCIADGSATDKFGATFIDGSFCNDELRYVSLTDQANREVFGCTIGFATFNAIGWWVHCGEPAEYVTRIEPYEMVFECRKCAKRHVIEDLD